MLYFMSAESQWILLMALPALLSPCYPCVCIFPPSAETLILLYVMGLHLLDMAVMEYVFNYSMKKSVFFFMSSSLSPQDGWQTLVSGLVAFLWLWHQHSQLHCLCKYLYSISVHVIVCVL